MAGRKPKEFDQKQFESLCAMFCTETEICNFFKTSDKTLASWCKRTYKMTFEECFDKFSAMGKISLRRTQYKAAVENQNITMLIWLGKQYLNQSDKQEISAANITDETRSEVNNLVEKFNKHAETNKIDSN